jgi:molecular chaperone DnaK
VINSPSAAALAFESQSERNKNQNVLVVDIGGGEYDVTLVSMKDGVLEV